MIEKIVDVIVLIVIIIVAIVVDCFVLVRLCRVVIAMGRPTMIAMIPIIIAALIIVIEFRIISFVLSSAPIVHKKGGVQIVIIESIDIIAKTNDIIVCFLPSTVALLVADWGCCGCGLLGAADCSGFPHFGQKLAPGSIWFPQFEQKLLSM
jgi:hypothetical protein